MGRCLGRGADHVERFIDALALNWLIAGTDAHAKNYSILLASGQVRLAPVYDVASSLPYDDMYLPRLAMAMRIGGEYRLQAVAARHWRRLATVNSLDPDQIIERVSKLAGRLPGIFSEVGQAESVGALNSELPGRLVKRVTEHAQHCLQALT